LGIDAERATDDRRLAAEAAPEVVADHGDVVATRLLLFGAETAAEERLHAKRGEKVGGRDDAGEAFRGLAGLRVAECPPLKSGERGGGFGAGGQVGEIGQGMRPGLRLR
jgi:hypothetical protein